MHTRQSLAPVYCLGMLKLSVLEQSPVRQGVAREALLETIELTHHFDALGSYAPLAQVFGLEQPA